MKFDPFDIIASICCLIAWHLVAKKNKWGPVIACVSQPIWIIVAYRAHYWGLLILSFLVGIEQARAWYKWWKL